MTATGETPGRFRTRNRLLVLSAIVATMLSGFIGVTVAAPVHMPTSDAPHLATPLVLPGPGPLVPHPLANIPVISYFYFSPSAFVETQGSTTIYSYVYGATAPYNLTYTGLPTGCASQNTTSFSCTPTQNGTFVVELTATDVYGNVSTANATLTVYPWAVEPFFGLTSSFASIPHSAQPCSVINASPFFTAYCYAQQQSPSLFSFPNGAIATSYSASTTTSGTACAGAAASTMSRVEVALSTDGGVTFGAPTDVGNDTCTYLNAIEPVFASSSTGMGYGVFVEENSSALPGQYLARGSDALGFVRSTNDGVTWSTASTLVAGGNIARPAIATFGSTVYVVYENIANSSTPLPGGGLPISLHFLVSTNGGSTWSAGQVLRGLNASQGYNAMSPSISVSATGTVAVAYATNRTCVNPASATSCYTWGDWVAVITTGNNGTTWSAVHPVATSVGETSCLLGPCHNALFTSTPQTSVSYSPNGNLYVGYSGTYSQAGASPASANYRYSGAWAALSTNGGGSWATQALGTAPFGAPVNYSNVNLGAANGALTATFSAQNGSYGTTGDAMSYTQWVTGTLTSGALDFTTPVGMALDRMPAGQNTNATAHSFVGFRSSVGFNSTGSPLIAFSLPIPASYSSASSTTYFYANYTYATSFSVGYIPNASTPGVAQVDFVETGLPAGTTWGFTLQGREVSTNASEIALLNVPTGIPMSYALGAEAVSGYGILQSSPATSTISNPVTFLGATTVTAHYHLFFAYNLSWEPFWPPMTGTYFEYDHFSYAYACNPDCLYSFLDQFRESFYINSNYGTELYNYSYTYWDDYSTGHYRGAYSDWYYYTGLGYGGYYNYSWGYPTAGDGNQYHQWLQSGTSFYPDYYIFGNPGAPISVAVGTGEGSYTGPMTPYYSFPPDAYYYNPPVALDMKGPINETMYVGGVSSAGVTFNESVVPYGLPSGTPYHFAWNGTNYTGVSPTAVSVLNQTAGGYPVTHVWANGSTSGWEYFGAVNPAGDVIVPYQPNVNLSFTSYEDLAAPTQAVAFHATSLATGTPWTLNFNGSTFTSTTPWINMTLHPGTYFASADPAISSDGASAFVSSFGPTVTIGSSTSTVAVPYGPSYKIQVNAATGGTVAKSGGNAVSSFTVWAAPGSQYTFTAAATPGWSFVGWTGVGAGAYTGTMLNATVTADGAITESAGFEPLPGARFNLTFLAAGLPAGTWWTVQLDGVGYSTNANTMTIPNLYAWTSGAPGRYTLAVPYAYVNDTTSIRYTAVGYPTLVGTNGTSTPPVTLTFDPQQLVTVASGTGGSAQLVIGGIPVGGTAWVSSGQSVVLQEQAAPLYTFAGWTGTGAGSYTGLQASPTVMVGASAITEYAAFAHNQQPPSPRYTLTLTESTSLAPGTSWGVTLNQGATSWNASSTGSALNFTGLLAGHYTLAVHGLVSPDGLWRYTSPGTNPTSVTVTGNQSLALSFTSWYWVEVDGSDGGIVGPSSAWVSVGSPVGLTAIPADGYQFNGWVGTGPGSYTGLNATATFYPTGPVTEVAQFVPIPPGTGPTASTIWQNTGVLAGLAAVGIVVGLVVGLLAFRGRRGGAAPEMRTAEPAPEPASVPEPEYMEGPPSGGGSA